MFAMRKRACNYCQETLEPERKKPYCSPCESVMYRECNVCHKPYQNEKFFKMHAERCNSCCKKKKNAASGVLGVAEVFDSTTDFDDSIEIDETDLDAEAMHVTSVLSPPAGGGEGGEAEGVFSQKSVLRAEEEKNLEDIEIPHPDEDLDDSEDQAACTRTKQHETNQQWLSEEDGDVTEEAESEESDGDVSNEEQDDEEDLSIVSGGKKRKKNTVSSAAPKKRKKEEMFTKKELKQLSLIDKLKESKVRKVQQQRKKKVVKDDPSSLKTNAVAVTNVLKGGNGARSSKKKTAATDRKKEKPVVSAKDKGQRAFINALLQIRKSDPDFRFTGNFSF